MLSNIVVLLCFCFALATASAVGDLRSLKTHADEARSVLSTIPEQCTTDSHLVTIEYVKALYSIFNCSYTEVINGAANIALETGAYVVMDYGTITKLMVQFASCAAELDPLKVIECGINQIVSAYSELKAMVASTETFITDMQSLIPPLKREIDNCLKTSSTEYKTFLTNLIHKSRTCEQRL